MTLMVKRLLGFLFPPKHKCSFTIPVVYKGYKYYKCDHEGCRMHEPDEDDRREKEAEWSCMLSEVKRKLDK